MTLAEELVFDTTLHIGSLRAVAIYFRNEMLMFVGGIVDLLERGYTDNAAPLVLTAIASIPIVIVGLLF